MKLNLPLIATLTLSATPAFCWDYTGNYYNLAPEDCTSIQTPAVIETVKIGGFALQLDRVEMGYNIYRSPNSNVLGDFQGDAFNIKVTRVPNRGQSLEQLALSMGGAGDHVSVTPVHASGGITGYRAEYGGKPNLFSKNIHAIRYFFVNQAGETICFDATATGPHTDWSVVKHFVNGTIAPARA